MRRVIWRSFSRAVTGRELWAGTGNREEFRRWLDKEHPIRWAWDTWAKNRPGEIRYEVRATRAIANRAGPPPAPSRGEAAA